MKISLTSICEEVVREGDLMSVRTLQRRFEKLICSCGGSLDYLKDNNNHVFFDESERLFVKSILEELYLNEGLASQFIDKHKTDDYVGLDKVHDFVTRYLTKLADNGAGENEIQGNLNFLGMLFLLPVKENYEQCHMLLDYIFYNLEQYPYTHQAIMTDKIKDEFKRMFACSMVESTINLIGLCEIIKTGQELSGDKNSLNWYGDDHIAVEYRERDRRAYRMMREDQKLKLFIEDRIGAKIDDLFPEVAKEYK